MRKVINQESANQYSDGPRVHVLWPRKNRLNQIRVGDEEPVQLHRPGESALFKQQRLLCNYSSKPLEIFNLTKSVEK